MATGGSFLVTSGGKIQGNRAAKGGGVYVNGGTLTMNSGAIEYNSVTDSGGAIYADSSSSIVLNAQGSNSVNIQYNAVPKGKNGGGIDFECDAAGKLSVNGNVHVTDNLADGKVTAQKDNSGNVTYTTTPNDAGVKTVNNVYLPAEPFERFITVEGKLTGGNGSIGVMPADNIANRLVAKSAAKAGTGTYNFDTEYSDKAAFVHDRITNNDNTLGRPKEIEKGSALREDNRENLALVSRFVNVTVPTEYLFLGIPNVFGNKIVAPNYTITNNSEDSKLKVEVAFENKNDDGLGNKNTFLVANNVTDKKLNGSTTASPDGIELYLSPAEGKSNNGFFIVDSTGTTTNATASKTDLLSKYNNINDTTGVNVFTLGILDEALAAGTTGTTSTNNSGYFTFTGKIGDYNIFDMGLNLHSKFKMIFKFTSI